MSKNLTVSNLYNMCKITYDNVTIASSEKFGTEAYLGYKDNKVDFIYRSKENEIVVFSNVKHIVLCEINIVFVLREEEQECLVVFNKKGYIVKKIYGNFLFWRQTAYMFRYVKAVNGKLTAQSLSAKRCCFVFFCPFQVIFAQVYANPYQPGLFVLKTFKGYVFFKDFHKSLLHNIFSVGGALGVVHTDSEQHIGIGAYNSFKISVHGLSLLCLQYDLQPKNIAAGKIFVKNIGADIIRSLGYCKIKCFLKSRDELCSPVKKLYTYYFSTNSFIASVMPYSSLLFTTLVAYFFTSSGAPATTKTFFAFSSIGISL